MLDLKQDYTFLEYSIESENQDFLVLQAEIPDSKYLFRMNVSKKGNQKFLLSLNNKSDKGEIVMKQ